MHNVSAMLHMQCRAGAMQGTSVGCSLQFVVAATIDGVAAGLFGGLRLWISLQYTFLLRCRVNFGQRNR